MGALSSLNHCQPTATQDGCCQKLHNYFYY
jgi:hypothetical protein